MKTSEILIKAKEAIANPENWIQGYYAFDKDRSPVGRGTHPSAVCFCSIGALQKVVGYSDDASKEFLNARKVREVTKVLTIAAGVAIVDYNDTHDHSEVMEVWDKAIKSAIQSELNQE